MLSFKKYIPLLFLSCIFCFFATGSTPIPQERLIQLKPWPFGQQGIFDPSLESDTNGNLYITYSAVDPSKAWPKQNQRTVQTFLARSNDKGKTWIPLGRINAIQDVKLENKPLKQAGTWHHEVSSLVYDPNAGPSSRWKLFWHHYLVVNQKRMFEHGWIGYKAAATPEALSSAKEVKLLSGLGYKDVNNNRQGATKSPLAGAPQININAMHPELKRCAFYSEPGAMATDDGLYLSVMCYKPVLFGAMGASSHVMLFKIAPQANIKSINSWQFLGEILKPKQRAAHNIKKVSAPDLFTANNTHYLIVSRVTDKPFPDAYKGCQVFTFENIDKGSLKTKDGKVEMIRELHGKPNQFNGACSYDKQAGVSGMLRSVLEFRNKRPYFTIDKSFFNFPHFF